MEWFFIPPGRTLIGMTDEDISFYQGSPSRMTSFPAFYMDQTEITNAEYRQFVNWVRDSVAVTTLGQSGAPNLYMPQPAAAAGTTVSGQRNINWKAIGKSGVLWGKIVHIKLDCKICIIQVMMLYQVKMNLIFVNSDMLTVIWITI